MVHSILTSIISIQVATIHICLRDTNPRINRCDLKQSNNGLPNIPKIVWIVFCEQEYSSYSEVKEEEKQQNNDVGESFGRVSGGPKNDL